MDYNKKPPSKKFACAILCLLLLTGCEKKAYAQQVNLALNKSYTMSPKPNYTYCTDPGDSYQLTDGESYGCDWIKKSTVGWMKPKNIIEIKIDLGSTENIDSIKIHSIGGGFAGTYYAENIIVTTSRDNITYEYAGVFSGDKLNKSATKVKNPQVLDVKNINKNARYINMLVRPYGQYFFADEIEIISSNVKIEATTGTIKSGDTSNNRDLFATIDKTSLIEQSLEKIEEVLSDKTNNLAAELQQELTKETKQLLSNIETAKSDGSILKKAAQFDRQTAGIRARILSEIYKKSYAVVPAEPMQTLYKSDLPVAKDPKNSIDIFMWQGEYESAAVNIMNCSAEPLTLFASISPLARQSDGTAIDSKNLITIRRAAYVYARQTGYIADALVLQKEQPFEIQPGEVVQLWLTVHCPNLEAGKYKTSIAIIQISTLGNKENIQQVEINVEIANIKFPEEVALNSCVWAYPEKIEATKNHLYEVARDLREHHINVYVVHTVMLPWPTNNKVDFSQFDSILKTNDYAGKSLFFLNFRQEWTRKKFGLWLSDEWKRNFTAWLNLFVNHLKTQGYDYKRFAIYPYDEMLGDDFYTIASLIKKTDPEIQIYANSFGENKEDWERFKKLIDIWCIHENDCIRHPNWLDELRNSCKNVWTYNTLYPGKSNDPYKYYRLQCWRAFARNLNGAGFWVYADESNSTYWDDTAKPLGYSAVIYGAAENSIDTSGENIITSRRWEAWREGVEDYEYLDQAAKAIKQLQTKNAEKSMEIRKILESQLKEIISSNDTTKMYEVRKIITKLLVEK
jgi:hypothetical protein